MTVTSTSIASYVGDDDQVEVGVCTECLVLVEADELRDCGTHRLCPGCLASATCSGCVLLRHEEAADRAEQVAYDSWRDQSDREDY